MVSLRAAAREGSVEFATYQEGTGAVGTYDLAGGIYKSTFDASWCISD